MCNSFVADSACCHYCRKYECLQPADIGPADVAIDFDNIVAKKVVAAAAVDVAAVVEADNACSQPLWAFVPS